MNRPTVAIIGGGPAGLTAAYDLVRHGIRSTVFEASAQVGGLARTETYKGYRFDIGGHRFYTSDAEVRALWRELLGDELIRVPRLSRIYYRGRFFNYPLSAVNTLTNLGVCESALLLGSYFKARIWPPPAQETFEDWVIARFGRRLYQMLFKGYTEKVWGISCREIRAEWAAQRIRGLSLGSAVKNALFGVRGVRTLIHEFDYPRLGPGQMWERCRDRIEEGGGRVELHSPVLAIHHQGKRVRSVEVAGDAGVREVAVDHLISSMPISKLVRSLRPEPPSEVLQAADGLKYRDFIIVALIIDKSTLFPDNWIYIHTPAVRVGRIQNFKNWSSDMVPDQSKTCLGMEYFCSQGDDLWAMDDRALIELARREIKELGLARASDVEDGHVIRQTKAYPIYDSDYRRHLEVIKGYLGGLENMQVVGRNGMHRYNNQDHSMLCGLYASRNLRGAQYNLWEINTERSYYEEQRVDQRPACEPYGLKPDRRAAV